MTMNTARLVTPAVTTAARIAAIDMERTLTQLPVWSSLTEREMDTLRRSAFVRHYKKVRSLLEAMNVSECCLFFPARSAPISSLMRAEVTLFRLYPGELRFPPPAISQITFDTQMTAGMDTDILIISANVIAALKEKISMSAVFFMNWQRNGF